MVVPDKSPVVGTPISTTTYDEVLGIITDRPDDRSTIIAVCNVHSVMSARRDPELRSALAASTVATPDGVPLVWTLRRTANPSQERVYGPDLMRHALADAPGLGHYLYGSTPETLDALQRAITRDIPEATVVGAFSPPFAPPSLEADAADVERIRASGADVVWVGLGMPKQELWMHRVADRLPGVVLVGVGAAFDFIAGTVPEAPPWMQRAGLEWLYRLSREPRRLWRRYLFNNPAFLVLMVRQIARSRRGRESSVWGSDTGATP